MLPAILSCAVLQLFSYKMLEVLLWMFKNGIELFKMNMQIQKKEHRDAARWIQFFLHLVSFRTEIIHLCIF